MEEPPSGWYVFGTHAGWDAEHVPLLEFSEELDEAGMPYWERPVDMSMFYPGVGDQRDAKIKLVRSFASYVDGMVERIVINEEWNALSEVVPPCDLISRDPYKPTVARVEADDDFVTYGAFYVDNGMLVRLINSLEPTGIVTPVCRVELVTRVDVISHGA